MQLPVLPSMKSACRTSAALLICQPALAQAPAASAAAPALGAGVLQMVMGLVLVLGLILGGLWLLKRLSSPGVGDGVLHVVAGIAVGPRERVVLVEIGDTWLVLGVAPGQVNTLHQLPRLEAGPQQVRKPIPARDFRNWLENALERKHAAR